MKEMITMVHLARWILTPVLLVGLLGTTASGTAEASKATERVGPPKEVNDQAGLFSKEAKEKANMEIANIKTRFNKDFLVETYSEGPAEAAAFKAFAEKKAAEKGVNGIYLVVTPKKYQVVVSNSTYDSKLFTDANNKKLVGIVAASLKNKKPDEALTEASSFVMATFDENKAKAPATSPAAARRPNAAPAQERAEIPWLKYILIGLAVLLVFWIVTGIIRAMSGGGGGYGYGGAGGGGGGGGGGGFFSSLLGGLFGAAAGMWMYNHFFGGGTPTSYGGDQGYGSSGGAADAGNDPGGYTSSGGDYDGGGDAGGGGGGGDWGGGGGDWGGGGGGGDWGGGGGGGGDW